MNLPLPDAPSGAHHEARQVSVFRQPGTVLHRRRVTTKLMRFATCFLLASLCAPGVERCLAHPISVTFALAEVSRDQVTVNLEGFLEDLYLFHDLKPSEEGILSPEEIMRGVELHKKFLAEKFQIRDANGELLKLKEVRLKEISQLDEGVHQLDLMAYETIFELQYELSSPPEFLTFTQKFTGELDLLPAEMLLHVEQENAGTPHSVSLMPHRSETVRFDWDNPTLSQESSDEEWENWFEEQKKKTLGITSYTSVYSFLYIEDHEVRHEILIPLATLSESVSLERDDDEFLDLNEQEAAREAIETHFLSGNPIEIDGVEVPGEVTRLNFYGVDFKDFAQQAPQKRVSLGSARVGIIVSYPSANPPQTVKLTWTHFGEFLRRVNLAVIAYENTLSATLGRVGASNFFEWKNPGRAAPAPIKEVKANLPPAPVLPLPVVSLFCLFLGVAVFVVLRKLGKTAKQQQAALVGFLLAAIIGWPFLRWDIPDPFRPPPEIPENEMSGVFSNLLQNIYAVFRYREESALYDALASSIHGDLLSDVYVEIQRGLVIEEQGGAISRVGEVEIVSGERIPQTEVSTNQTSLPNGFGYRCQWNVTGTVEHWGHIHERTNQYSAEFAVAAIDGAWKITEFKLLNEERIATETRLRTLTVQNE